MVNKMNVLENRFPMHESVRPIEVGVMQNDDHWNAYPEVNHSVIAHIAINLRVARFDNGKEKHTDD